MKKFFKIVVRILLGLIVLPIIIFLFIWVTNLIYIGGVDEVNTQYLSKNKVEIDKNIVDTNPATEIFDSAFYNNNVFFLGENHGYADVQLIDKYMIIHLNKKIGLRYYLAEIDSLRARKLNEFLSKDEKDTLLLKQVVNDIRLRIPQQSSRELYQKWFDIYEYNKILPDSLKIIVLGVDKNFEDEGQQGRDSIMLINFKNIVASKGLQHEKFYGYFGYSHVLQNGYGKKDIHPFAAKIKESNFLFSNKTQSIVCLTLDSDMYMPPNNQYPSPPDEKTPLFNLDGPFVLVSGIKDLKEVSNKNTITIFSLNNTDSPYRHSQKLAGVKAKLFGNDVLPNNENQNTTDFFQYAILIRNSKALTRLNR